MIKPAKAVCWLLFFALPSLASCEREKDHGRSADGSSKAGRKSEAYLEKGDLPALRKRGKLRILLPARNENRLLVRQDFPPDLEKDLAERCARRLGLEPVSVYVELYRDLLPYLLAGKGDLVVAGLTVTPEREERAAFSIPLAVVREQVVTRADDDGLSKPSDLSGRRVTVRRSSSYYQTLLELKKKVPGLIIEEADERLDTEQLLHRVAGGRIDLTVSDDSLVRAVKLYTPGLKAAFDLSANRPTTWAMRPAAAGLRRAVDQFLGKAGLADDSAGEYIADLPGIRKRKVLRVLTTNTAATYFLLRGRLLGFEYELVSEFARRNNLYVKLIVPPSNHDLLPWLKAGRGDLIAAALTITQARRKQGLAFSRPYSYATETVVCRAGEKELHSPRDLAGRKLYVRKSSSYFQTLEKLRRGGIDFELSAAGEELNTEEIIAKVAAGEYDLTVADSDILAIESCYRDDIRAAFALGEPVAHGWAVNEQNKKLLAAVNSFFDKEYRGVFYNLTYRKYFANRRNIRTYGKLRAGRSGRISNYDGLFMKFARKFGFDWRLIAAQSYVESRFDPRVRSWVGARGLMQIMPRTAKELGFKNIVEPGSGIQAGMKYLAIMRNRFEPELKIADRNSFALAAYNAGYGHVLDARRLAEARGLDADRWSENVERAMLLLSRPNYAKQARYGYCRGSEPVAYVRKIFEHYQAFTRASE